MQRHDGIVGSRPVLAAIADLPTTGVFVTDPDGRCEMVSERWSSITGLSEADAQSDGWIDAIHPDDRADVVSAWWLAAQSATRFDHRFRFVRPDGAVSHVRSVAHRVVDDDGTVMAWVGSVDVDSLRPESGIRSRAYLEAALVNSSDVVVIIDAAAKLVFVSSASERMFGLRSADWLGRSVLELLHPDDQPAAIESLVTSVDSGVGVKDPIEVRIRHADGSWRDVEIVANNLLDDTTVHGILINARDVSERREAQRREARARSRFEQAFVRSPIGMALTDLDGRFVRVNDALAQLLDASPAELPSDSMLGRIHPDELLETISAAVEVAEGRRASDSLEIRLLRGDGSAVWTRCTMTMLADHDGTPLHLLLQIENIEERRQLLERLRQSALHDPLTGLLNRAGLAEHASGIAPNSQIGVIALDLDNFKQVNDELGHAAGDQVLQALAGRFQHLVRPDMVAARAGGDEFVLLSDRVHSVDSVHQIAERIVAAAGQPVAVGGRSVVLGASVGYSIGRSEDLEGVQIAADRASYAAKRAGGGRSMSG